MERWGAAGDRGTLKGTTKMHERWRKITKFRLGSCGGTWGAAGDREKVKIGAGWMTGAVGDRGTLKGTTKMHERWRNVTKFR